MRGVIAGHFWGFHQTRPYMRATHGLARALGEAGRVDEAVAQYDQLLRLNPDDNQGVRYEFVALLLAADRIEEAWTILDAYPEQTTLWLHLKAIGEYLRGGSSPAARQAVRDALDANRHVVPLLQSNEFPPEPHSYAPGSFEEAAICIDDLRQLWDETEGYLPWLFQGYLTWERGRPKDRRPAKRRPTGGSGKPKRR